jgi:hypothetical protein
LKGLEEVTLATYSVVEASGMDRLLLIQGFL